jgi:hypothetical protein
MYFNGGIMFTAKAWFKSEPVKPKIQGTYRGMYNSQSDINGDYYVIGDTVSSNGMTYKKIGEQAASKQGKWEIVQ